MRNNSNTTAITTSNNNINTINTCLFLQNIYLSILCNGLQCASVVGIETKHKKSSNNNNYTKGNSRKKYLNRINTF